MSYLEELPGAGLQLSLPGFRMPGSRSAWRRMVGQYCRIVVLSQAGYPVDDSVCVREIGQDEICFRELKDFQGIASRGNDETR